MKIKISSLYHTKAISTRLGNVAFAVLSQSFVRGPENIPVPLSFVGVAVSPVAQKVTAIGTDTYRQRATLLESYVVLVLDLTIGGAYRSPVFFLGANVL
jgi:hypothetical protein